MIVPDVTKTPEYRLGWEWATEHGPLLAELFTGKDVSTPELRVRLFKEATRMWPSQRDTMEHDLNQTAFVAGAIKAAIDTLPLTADALAATFEASMEMGTVWSTEQWKNHYLEELKKKPVGWWRRKFGDARPLDIVNVLSSAWRRDWAKERDRPDPGSKWAVLIDTMGSREISVLADLTRIEEHKSGDYFTYYVTSPDGSFEVLSRPVYAGGRMYRYPGEIVG